MATREDGAPFIARCTYQQAGRGVVWQCRLTDPHEGVDHDLPIDAEFGRDLDVQDPLWLAAKLRDQVAKTRHAEAKVQRVERLADTLDEEAQRFGGGIVGDETAERIRLTLGGSRD